MKWFSLLFYLCLGGLIWSDAEGWFCAGIGELERGLLSFKIMHVLCFFT